ncbi:hypothetical protein ES703_36080 [subsurface metagenome]
MNIQQLLARRSDLGTFLVHLTREYPKGKSAKQNLQSMLDDSVIEARNPFGVALSRLNKLKATTPENLCTQNVVCFTETPLEHVHLLTEEIQGRKFEFSPYGIAITKRTARMFNVNPIWYIDITWGHTWLANYLDGIIDPEIQNNTFAVSDIAKLTPFIETMGQGPTYFKEYWWEREWRHVGDYALQFNKFLIICPEEDFQEVSNVSNASIKVTPFIDPIWSLEQIIGRLAGFKSEDIDPF